jgi:dihydropteroate synthase-like protein
MQREHIHFVTGRLAEHALHETLQDLAPRIGFEYSIDVLNITVAALMTPQWIADRIQVPPQAGRVLVPGYCEGDLSVIEQACGRPVERGPRDLRRLPTYFGHAESRHEYGAFDIEILAEINHCPRLSLEEILREARRLAESGADVIDVGCNPGETWTGVGEVVRALRDQGHRVSIDSLNVQEIAAAAEAGAELVLSVNNTNCRAAADWGCEVVVVPDVPETLAGLDATVELLATKQVRLRIDPVLSPIGFGFAESLGRYLEVRRRYPDAEMMMGIGNLTELTDADSAAINVLLLGFCQEIGIRSVLTTEVINWARSSVRECDLARRLVYHAVEHQVLPKHLEPRLVMLRDADRLRRNEAELARLAEQIRDSNYRIFAEDGEIHLLSAGLHLASADPFTVFDQLLTSASEGTAPKNLDASHAFYLGFEMAKALTALTLDKQYEQDEALEWGLLTRPEKHQRLPARRKKQGESDTGDG